MYSRHKQIDSIATAEHVQLFETRNSNSKQQTHKTIYKIHPE